METILLIVSYFFAFLGIFVCCAGWAVAGSSIYIKIFGVEAAKELSFNEIPKFKHIVLGIIFCGPLMLFAVIVVLWDKYIPILLQKLRDWHNK